MLFRDTGLPEKDLIKKAFVRLQEGIRNDLDHNRNINTKNIDQQLDAMKQQFERKNPNATHASTPTRVFTRFARHPSQNVTLLIYIRFPRQTAKLAQSLHPLG